MENVETKKKIIGLPSTIVAGIFITISLFFVIISLTMNLKVAIEQYTASVQETANENSENAGEMIIVASLVAGIGLLAILIVYYGVIAIPFITVSFCLIPVIKNLKRADVTAIRVINYVYLGLIAASHIICITKFILYAIGVA